jgi:hypothetical protein
MYILIWFTFAIVDIDNFLNKLGSIFSAQTMRDHFSRCGCLLHGQLILVFARGVSDIVQEPCGASGHTCSLKLAQIQII